MSSRNRMPTALEPYLRPPPETSLVLLTGTLGCSTTWLTSRFVGRILGADEGEVQEEAAVVLVSWLHDEAFWKGEIRRATGRDATKLSASHSFAFVDGLTSLATCDTSSALPAIGKAITSSMEKLHPRRTTLILDAPDTLLATGTATSQDLHLLLLRLRSQAHSAILSLSADWPLISASTPALAQQPPTPLGTESAAFLVQQAHLSRLIVSVRELETGAARDVSGVVQVTRGGCAYEADGVDGHGEEAREMEALYVVQRDGGAKVFGRGSECVT